MRKTVISFVSLAVVAMALLSCAKEASIKDRIKASKSITVNVIAENASTRTEAVDGEIPIIKWLESDKIGLIEIVDDEIKGIAESSTAYIQGGKADFSTTLGWEASGSSYKYTAVYPSYCIGGNSGSYYIYLPEEQYLNGNNFSDDSDILISTVYDNGASRAEDGQPLMFSFRRLGSVVRLNLAGLAAGEKIYKVVLTGPDSITGALEFDPVTASIDPNSLFYDFNSVTLHLDGYEASGSGDPIWFRVLPNRNWNAGEDVSLKVWTDKAIYYKEITLASDLEFPNGGLTKLGVNVAGFIAEPLAVPTLWDFESGADDWTFLDEDGDGYNWFVYGAAANSGEYALVSESYDNDTYEALTPDNWAFTPPILLTEGNYLSFWIRAQDPNYQEEHYAVYIAEGSPYAPTSELMEETEFPNGSYVELGQDGLYQHHIIQIPSEFNNKVVCIGFRHFNCSDCFWLDLDDVSVTEEYPYEEPTMTYYDYLGDWAAGPSKISIEQNVEGTSYFISGLSGQKGMPVEALFENHRLVLREQIVQSEGNVDIALQGSDGYFPVYPDGSAPVIFSAAYDEDAVQLNITPSSGNEYYMFITYEDQSRVDYSYTTIPAILVPYVPDETTYLYYEDFESDVTGAWTFIDADGDGYNWDWTSNFTSYSGDYLLASASYINNIGALEPDNWAFTPPVTLTSNNYLCFWIRGQDPNYYEEHYAVYITDSEPTAENLDECAVLLEEQEYPNGSPVEIGPDGAYQRYVIQIPSSYDGKAVYIGFRHFNCFDCYWLDLDDVAISEGDPLAVSVPAPAPKSMGGKYSLPEVRRAQPSAKVGVKVQPQYNVKRH